MAVEVLIEMETNIKRKKVQKNKKGEEVRETSTMTRTTTILIVF